MAMMTEQPKTFAEEYAAEAERLRRRFVHVTRPRGPMTWEQAQEHCRRMAGADGEKLRAPVPCKWPNCARKNESPPRGKCECSLREPAAPTMEG